MSKQVEQNGQGRSRTSGPRRCPECGTPPGAVPLRPPWWAHLRYVFAIAALLLAAAWIGFRNWEAWPVPVPVGNIPAGMTPAQLPMQPITRAELTAIAEGGSGTSSVPLIAQFAGSLGNPHEELAAGFVSGHGSRTELHGWGWPITVYMTRWYGVFDNVYHPGDSRAPYAPRDPVWSQGSYYQFRTDDRGRDGRSMIGFPMLMSSIALFAGAWWLGAVIRSAARRLCRPARPWDPPRLVRRLPIVLLVLTAITMAVMSARPRDDSFMNPAPLIPPEMVRLGLTTCEVSELAGESDGDAQLARVMLGALDAQSEGYLALGLYRLAQVERNRASGGWPMGTISRARDVTALPPKGRGENGTDWSLRWQNPRIDLEIIRPGRGPGGAAVSTVVTRWSISDWRIGQLLLVLLMAWWVGRAVPGVAGIIERRRIRRWHARGHCLCCGYDVLAGRRND